MSQNTSTAVMARRFQPADDLDFFPTPGWGTRALCEHLIDLTGATVWEGGICVLPGARVWGEQG